MTLPIYIALVAIVALLLAVLLEVLAREAAALKARARKLRDSDFRQITKYDAGVERKRLR